MAMNRRRLMLGIGAALLVGGWGMLHYQVDGDIARVTGLSSRVTSIVLAVGIAIGAGLIGFAVLRPTNHKDELAGVGGAAWHNQG